MPDPSEPEGVRATLRSPGLTLRLSADGDMVVSLDGAPGVSPLLTVGPLTVLGPVGRAVPPGAAVVTVDADEVAVVRADDGLRTTVRHSVDAAWDLRVVLANESAADLELDGLRLEVRAGTEAVATGLAAGAMAAYAVQPVDGEGPVLLGRLRTGTQSSVDRDGWRLGPLTLAAGHRWSASWRFEVGPDARRSTASDLPRTPWLDLDQTVVLPGGLDVAVLAPGLEVEVEQDHIEVGTTSPGSHVVELRGPRGTSRLALSWAPDLDDLVAVAAAAVLDGARTSAGTPRLPDAAAGVVVQDALDRRLVAAREEAAEALELLLGNLLDPPDAADSAADSATDSAVDAASGIRADPFELPLLAREADRTGDDWLLREATAAFLGVGRPVAGLGLAGVLLAVAHLRTGRPADAVTRHLETLGRDSGPGRTGLAELELALLVRPSRAPLDDHASAGLRRLGAVLGAGLPGRVLTPAAPAELAYAATLLGLVDEDTGQRLRGRWGITAAELARRVAAQARTAAGTDGNAARATLAWLVLGRTPR